MGKLSGKTLLFLGSSVTEGSAANGVSFADILSERDGIIMYKEAVGGTTMGGDGDSTYVARMKHGHLPQDIRADALICQLSTNDASQGIGLDAVERAIREIVDYTRETWDCKVFFYTGTRFDSDAYCRMVGLLYSLSGELGYGIIDLWSSKKLRAVSEEDYARYMQDPIHPNIIGYTEWWYPFFKEYLERVM